MKLLFALMVGRYLLGVYVYMRLGQSLAVFVEAHHLTFGLVITSESGLMHYFKLLIVIPQVK